MLELKPRIDFGGQSWPHTINKFSLEWLKNSFHPEQVARRNRIMAAIADGEARVAGARKAAVENVPQFGEQRANGIYRSAADQQLQRAAKTLADHQAVDQIRRIRQEIDTKVLGDLKDMERAALASKLLSTRVFDKISCLSRVKQLGWTDIDLIVFKSNFSNIIRGMASIELHRVAQACIDDGNPLSLVQLDCVRMENFNRPKSDRPFLNQTVLDYVTVPEFEEAVGSEQKPGLLRQVVQLHAEAGRVWASFLGNIGQVSTLRIARGLAQVTFDTTGVPAVGREQ